jgi:TPR repeat protein
MKTTTLQLLPTTTHGTPSGNYDGSSLDFAGTRQQAANYYGGFGVAQDHAEALRLFQLAAAQGLPAALFNVAECHEHGQGVPKNKAEAIRWYRRAQAAGYPGAAAALQRLRA